MRNVMSLFFLYHFSLILTFVYVIIPCLIFNPFTCTSHPIRGVQFETFHLLIFLFWTRRHAIDVKSNLYPLPTSFYLQKQQMNIRPNVCLTSFQFCGSPHLFVGKQFFMLIFTNALTVGVCHVFFCIFVAESVLCFVQIFIFICVYTCNKGHDCIQHHMYYYHGNMFMFE